MKRATAWIGKWRLGAEILLARYSIWLGVALGLLVLIGLGLWSVVMPLRLEVHQQRAALAALSNPSAAPKSNAAPAPVGAPARTELEDVLPAASRYPVDLRTLHDLARKHKLAWTQADYQRVRERHGQYESLHVMLPLSGSYPAIRRWVEDALRALPHASIDQIAFEREAIGTPQLVARIRLTLLLQPAQTASKSETAHSTPSQ